MDNSLPLVRAEQVARTFKIVLLVTTADQGDASLVERVLKEALNDMCCISQPPQAVACVMSGASEVDTCDTARLVEQARSLYAMGSDDDIEIDDDAIVSRGGDAGHWVQARVWVPDTDTE